ncbi:MAG TPA: universal stress protein [Steroidobacteraceae bacterium]|nr:universal stress protein [Steroidobacteraceae bacterium]
MRSIRRILIAIKDPQARSPLALNKGAQLARSLGARLELFHALTWPIYARTDEESDQIRARDEALALRRLQRLADRLTGRRKDRPLRVSVAVCWDHPAYEAIIRRANAIRADLIMAERHHAKHFAPLLLHFNDWELLRRSPVPVLLVKRGGHYERPVVLAAVDPTHSRDKPAQLDGIILDIGGVIATALRGRLHSVHACVPLAARKLPYFVLDHQTPAALNRRMQPAARHRYERLLNGYRISKAHRHLLNLTPSDAIQAVAATTHADIVALGALSRSGWQRLLIGNTAEELLDALQSDLLVVKPPHFKARVPRRPTGVRFVTALSVTP